MLAAPRFPELRLTRSLPPKGCNSLWPCECSAGRLARTGSRGVPILVSTTGKCQWCRCRCRLSHAHGGSGGSPIAGTPLVATVCCFTIVGPDTGTEYEFASVGLRETKYPVFRAENTPLLSAELAPTGIGGKEG
jgi:hypothetical protein